MNKTLVDGGDLQSLDSAAAVEEQNPRTDVGDVVAGHRMGGMRCGVLLGIMQDASGPGAGGAGGGNYRRLLLGAKLPAGSNDVGHDFLEARGGDSAAGPAAVDQWRFERGAGFFQDWFLSAPRGATDPQSFIFAR